MLLTAAMLAVGMVALGGRVEAAIAGATVALAQRGARRGSSQEVLADWGAQLAPPTAGAISVLDAPRQYPGSKLGQIARLRRAAQSAEP